MNPLGLLVIALGVTFMVIGWKGSYKTVIDMVTGGNFSGPLNKTVTGATQTGMAFVTSTGTVTPNAYMHEGT